MSLPAIIFLVLLFLDLGYHVGRHGEPRPDYCMFSKLIDTVAVLGILYWGNFFN